MAAQYIELDPKGDVILVLNNFPRQQDQGKDDFDDSPSLPAVLPDEISFQRPIGEHPTFLNLFSWANVL